MIGDEYFQLRAQIGTSLFSLAKVARDLEASEPAQATLQTLQAGLREPFLFLTLGETAVGKSSLLNALFERVFAGDAALFGRAAVYRYGEEERDLPVTEELIEAHRPHSFLRDFTLVDTPGLDAPAAAPQVLTRFLATADLILFVFPVKGDAAASWSFLAQVERESLRRFVFLVQRADTVSADEMVLTVKRLRHTMLSKLAQACPIFTVSAETRAGVDKLERYIDSEIVASETRRAKLIEVCVAAQNILTELGEKPRVAFQAVDRERRRLEEERLALAARKDQSLRHSGGALWSLAQTFQAALKRGEDLLRGKLTLLGLLRTPPEFWVEFRREVEERLREAAQRQIDSSTEHLEAELRDAWKEQQTALKNLGFETPLPFTHRRAELSARLAEIFAAREPDGTITNPLAQRTAAAGSMLKLPAFAMLAAATVFAGALAAGRFIQGCAILAAFVATVTVVIAWSFRHQLVSELRTVMNSRREAVLAAIEDEFRAEIDRFYRDLDAHLQPLEEQLAVRRAQCEPKLVRLQQLNELFDKTVADLKARRFSAATTAGGAPPDEEPELVPA